jgi:signal transduction histidine kinase
LQSDHSPQITIPSQDLAEENRNLLGELETAYKNMEMILNQSDREKAIAYEALQQKFQALEDLYDEMTRKENMLIHLEKLSSIGQFIAEIVHELKNPLTVISGHAEVALLMAESEDLRMAYKGKEDFSLFDLNENLRDCLSTVEIIKPKKIEMTSSFCNDTLIVQGDPYQISQVILNLAKNAFDAMENRGNSIRVETKKVSSHWMQTSKEVGQAYCQNEATWVAILEETDQFALIEFSDNGNGIQPELLGDLFQAFFTTKDRGKGTGLGLSISSDIAMRHGGNLTVKSVPGMGTTFQLILPLDSPEGSALDEA